MSTINPSIWASKLSCVVDSGSAFEPHAMKKHTQSITISMWSREVCLFDWICTSLTNIRAKYDAERIFMSNFLDFFSKMFSEKKSLEQKMMLEMNSLCFKIVSKICTCTKHFACYIWTIAFCIRFFTNVFFAHVINLQITMVRRHMFINNHAPADDDYSVNCATPFWWYVASIPHLVLFSIGSKYTNHNTHHLLCDLYSFELRRHEHNIHRVDNTEPETFSCSDNPKGVRLLP